MKEKRTIYLIHNGKSHNQGVERDANIRGGLIGQGFWRAPHPSRYAVA